MSFAVLVALFVAERAHQWQSLLSRDWSIRWKGQPLRRSAVVATALLIAWGEGLGFYVQSDRAFWAMIFWVYAAHVIVTGVLALRSVASPAFRVLGSLALVVATLVMMLLLSRGQSLVPLAFVLLLHALPCFVWNLWQCRPGRRLPSAAAAVALAALEWWLVAKSIWFPDGSVFPDLVDWWDLGDGANFLLHPIWMAPFLAHVAIDAVRFFQAPTGAMRP